MHTGSSRLALALMLAVLVACGGEPPSTARGGGPSTLSTQEVRACDLLDLATAASIIGSGAEHPGGDTERDTCLYSSPGVALLTIQIGSSDLYDQISIPQPHTAVSIGDRGRYTEQASGTTAVEFVKGDYTATIGVRPIGSQASAYLDPLLAAARSVASRLP